MTVELPEGWREVALEDLATLQRGFSYSSKNLSDEKSGIPLVNLKNFQKGGGFREDGLKYFVGDAPERVFIRSGDLVIANTDLSGARDVLGSPFVLPGSFGNKKAVFSHHLTKITLLDAGMSKAFMSFFLMSPQSRGYMKMNSAGTTVINLHAAAVKALAVPLPPLPEQQRIVEILEEQFSRLDAALASIRTVREKAQAFRRSLLHSAFTGELTGGTEGWREVALGDVVTGVRKTHPLNDAETYELWSVPSFADGKPEQVQGSQIKSGKLAVQEGDVLVSKINPRINRVWVVAPSTGQPQISSTEWLVARIKDLQTSTPAFLRYFLSAPKFRAWITTSASSVTGSHMRAKAEKILQQEIALPSLTEQQRIVGILEEQFSRLDNALQIADQLEARIASERRSLLHSAFTGALTAQWRKNQ